MRRPGNLIFSERLGARAATDSLFSPLERAKERDREREGGREEMGETNEKEKEGGWNGKRWAREEEEEEDDSGEK